MEIIIEREYQRNINIDDIISLNKEIDNIAVNASSRELKFNIIIRVDARSITGTIDDLWRVSEKQEIVAKAREFVNDTKYKIESINGEQVI
jgi:hypothetical protein